MVSAENYAGFQAGLLCTWPVGHTADMEYRFGYAGIYLYPQFNFGRKVSFFINAGPGVLILTNSYVSGEKHLPIPGGMIR